MSSKILLVILGTIILILATWIAWLYTHPIIKYTSALSLTCAIYNESGTYSMACNPIDIETRGEKKFVWGFDLPANVSVFNINKIIYCTYDLNNKRFVECHQFSEGVLPLNESS